jgi:hypothetical protein
MTKLTFYAVPTFRIIGTCFGKEYVNDLLRLEAAEQAVINFDLSKDPFAETMSRIDLSGRPMGERRHSRS